MRNVFVVIALLGTLVLTGCGKDQTAQGPADKFSGTWISDNHSMYIWPCGSKYILEYTHPAEDESGAMKTVKVPATLQGGRLHVTVRFDELTITPNGGDMLVFQDKPYRRTQTVSQLEKRAK